MLNVFVLSTPLHVYNAGELVFNYYHDNENWFIVTSDIAKEYIPLVETLKNHGISIRVFDEHQLTVRDVTVIPKTFLRAIIKARFLGKCSELPYLQGIKIDRFIVFTPNALSLYIRYMHPEAEVVFGEDGIGSYTGAIYDRLFYLDETCSSSFPNLKKRLLSRFARIFYGDRLLMRPSKIYLHLPSFSLVVQPCDICEMSHNEEYVDYCARFYVSAFKDAFDKNYEEFDFLFLGQPPENAQEKAAYDMAIKTVDRIGCNYAYRKHPREQIDRVHNSGGLWEFRCLAEIHDDSILVSSFSTAAITPLLYYGKKPWLLFFYPMVNGLSEENRKRLDAMAEALRSEYKLPEKVMVAENAKALASQLERLVALRKAVRSNTEAVRVHDESA